VSVNANVTPDEDKPIENHLDEELSEVSLESLRRENFDFGSDGNSSASSLISSIGSENDMPMDQLQEQAVAMFRSRFQGLLAQWLVNSNIAEKKANNLLHLLRMDPNYKHLPKSKKTIVHTPSGKVGLKIVPPGVYFHFGLLDGLEETLESTWSDLSKVKTLKIHVGIDGVALTESNNKDFWPIAAYVSNVENAKVFVIGVYEGPHKPESVELFLEDFVQDFVEIDSEGFSWGPNQFDVRLDALICDVPAKAYVLQILGHVGKLSCFYCDVSGEKGDAKATYFPVSSGQLRTEESFRGRQQPGHHIGDSPIERIPNFQIVGQVPMDPMHLQFLGIMKRLLKSYFLLAKTKLPRYVYEEVNSLLLQFAKHLPCEFTRKCRPLELLGKYKATECRLFLLYTGPVLFSYSVKKDFPNYYREFMLFHAGSKIFSSSEMVKSVEWVEYAQKLYDIFVKEYPNIHTKFAVSSNVHALLHAKLDIFRHGEFTKYSAFPFENSYRHMKKLLKANGNFLQQFVKRTHERRAIIPPEKPVKPKRVGVQGPQHAILQSAEMAGCSYKKLSFGKAKIFPRPPNNCVKLSDGSIFLVSQIAMSRANPNTILISGRKFVYLSDFYEIPLRSSTVGVYLAKKLASKLHCVKASRIVSKCICLPLPSSDKFAVMAMSVY
jgi:hypothetical protein